MSFDAILKHMAGMHNQQRHAGDRGGSEFREYETPDDYAELVSAYGLSDSCLKNPQLCKDITTYSRADAYTINRRMREDLPPLMDSHERIIQSLDKAFKEMPKVPEDMKVFRGLDDYGNILHEDLEIGDAFKDRAFVSTSADILKGTEYTSDSADKIVEIRLKKGQPGIYIEDIARHKHEREMLLPRNATFTVVDKLDDRLVVEMSTDD